MNNSINLYNNDADIIEEKLDWLLEVGEAAKKLIQCKGRHHAEINYKQLELIIKREPK